MNIEAGAIKPGGGMWRGPASNTHVTSIANYTEGLALVCGLQPRTFTDNGLTHAGLIAEELTGAAAAMVANDATVPGGKTVDMNRLLMALVNSVCALQAQLAATGCAPTTVGLTVAGGAGGVGHNVGLPAGGVGYRLTITGDAEWTGMVAGAAGRCVHLFNASTKKLKLKDQDAASTAANRFACPEQSDYDLKPFNFVTLQYDATLSRWIVLSTGESE